MSILTEPHREQRPLHSKTSATIQHFLAQKQKKRKGEKGRQLCTLSVSERSRQVPKAVGTAPSSAPPQQNSKLPPVFFICYNLAAKLSQDHIKPHQVLIGRCDLINNCLSLRRLQMCSFLTIY